MCGHCGRTAKTCGRVGRNTNMCGPRWPHRKHVRPALAAPQTCAAALAAIQTRAAAFAATRILAAGTATPQSFAAGTATPQSTAAGTATPQSFAAGTAAPQALAAATAAAQISGCPTGRRLIDTNITRPRRPRADFEVRSEGPALIADQSASALGRDALAVPPPPARHPQPLSHCDEKMRGEGSKSAARRSPAPVRLAGKGPRPARLAEVPSVSGAREQEAASRRHGALLSTQRWLRNFVVLKSSVFRLIQNHKSKIQNPNHLRPRWTVPQGSVKFPRSYHRRNSCGRPESSA